MNNIVITSSIESPGGIDQGPHLRTPIDYIVNVGGESRANSEFQRPLRCGHRVRWYNEADCFFYRTLEENVGKGGQ
jgi:hypothetical protein